MAKIKTALVIGGGIAGPVTALALRKAGIEATVHEAYADTEAYTSTKDGLGGVFMVAPNGLAALRIVGLDEAVRAIGQPIGRMVVGNGNGRRFGEFTNLPGQPNLAMWRADLNRVVRERAGAAGIRFEYGKRLVDVREAPTGVTALFADGSTATADVLIGADGIRSTVRTLIDPDAPDARYVGLLGFGGFADGPAPAEPDAMHFVYGRQAFFGYWTLPNGGTGWFSNLPHEKPLPMGEARQVPSGEWLRQLRATHADDIPARDVLRRADPDDLIVIGSLEILPKVPHWHRGRMVLVGDAAHAPSSSSGQGASLAVESAVQVARCLRDMPDPVTAFGAYERLRRARVEKIAANAAKNNRQKAYGPVGTALMSVLMPIAMKTFLKPEKMFGPVHNYRIDWDSAVTG